MDQSMGIVLLKMVFLVITFVLVYIYVRNYLIPYLEKDGKKLKKEVEVIIHLMFLIYLALSIVLVYNGVKSENEYYLNIALVLSFFIYGLLFLFHARAQYLKNRGYKFLSLNIKEEKAKRDNFIYEMPNDYWNDAIFDEEKKEQLEKRKEYKLKIKEFDENEIELLYSKLKSESGLTSTFSDFKSLFDKTAKKKVDFSLKALRSKFFTYNPIFEFLVYDYFEENLSDMTEGEKRKLLISYMVDSFTMGNSDLNYVNTNKAFSIWFQKQKLLK